MVKKKAMSGMAARARSSWQRRERGGDPRPFWLAREPNAHEDRDPGASFYAATAQHTRPAEQHLKKQRTTLAPLAEGARRDLVSLSLRSGTPREDRCQLCFSFGNRQLLCRSRAAAGPTGPRPTFHVKTYETNRQRRFVLYCPDSCLT